MKKEIADRWVKALRSGDYQQTTSKLKTSEGYCCLGVLAEICPLEIRGEWTDYHHGYSTLVKYDDGDGIESNVLPERIWKWAGMRGENPHSGKWSLAEWNDKGSTFAEIADIIEKSWEIL